MAAATSGERFNELPMYGGRPKTPEAQAADARFVQEAVRITGSRDAAANASIRLGYRALLQERDPAAAMRRFNQAWLLAPDDCRVYQGMAITAAETARDKAAAHALFERSTAAPKLNWSCFNDRIRFLNVDGRHQDALRVVAEARAAPIERTAESAVRLDALEALANFQAGRFDAACPVARDLRDRVPADLRGDLVRLADAPACRGRSA